MSAETTELAKSQLKRDLVGHLAVVTGASSGIGEEYARQLAARGADVVVAARRLERLERLADKLSTDYGVNALAIDVDLADPAGPKQLFDRATADGRTVTMLINNAGIGSFGPFHGYSLDKQIKTLTVNCNALTELCYTFAQHMLEHGKKSYITNVGSIASFQPTPFFAVYSGSKGYVRFFSEALNNEFYDTNVSVCCVCPGGTYTEFLEHAGQSLTNSGHKAMMKASDVVSQGIHAMLREKSVLVPGFLNKLATFLPRFFPRDWAVAIAGRAIRNSTDVVTDKLDHPQNGKA